MTKQGSTSKTRLTELLKRSVRPLGVRTNPRSAGRFPASVDDRARQYAHEKPTKTENVVGAPKPSLPPLELHVSTAVVPDVDGVKLDRSRVLITRPGRALLVGEHLEPVDVEVVRLFVSAPRMARLLTRIVRAAKPGTVALADFTEAQQLVEALPFEVLS